jgi:3-dehydroquinate dehydratase type I
MYQCYAVWTRRYPLFEECSTHTYASLTVHNSLLHPKCPSLILKDVEKDFIRFVKHISSPTPVPMPSQNRRSYSLTLDLPVPQDIDYQTMDAATAGVDTIELRVDSIRRAPSSFKTPASTPASNPGCPDHAYVAFAVAHLRRLSSLPIIYAIRTVRSTTGSFVFSPETEGDYLKLALCAFKLGVDYLDIEINTDPELVRKILALKPANTRIILTFIDETDQLHWHDHEVAHVYLQALDLKADAVRIRLSASNSQDNVEIEQFLKRTLAISGQYPGIPVIAANYGSKGKMSPLFNEFLTPVNHPALPTLHAHARGTYADIQRTLAACGLIQSKAIAYRRGIGPQDLVDHKPIMKAGIRILGLPIHLEEELNASHTNQVTLSGALVSLPLVGNIQQGTISPSCAWTHHIDAITLDDPDTSSTAHQAATNGNANGNHQTRESQQVVHYHNIRSLSIADTIIEGLSPINAISEVSTALLIGASGQRGREAAYALKELGIPTTFCVACDTGISEPPFLIPFDNLSLLNKRSKPTVIITFSNNLPSTLDSNTLSLLLSSPTGGTLVELDIVSGQGALMRNILENGKKDAWVCLARQDVEFQVLKREFELITGCRLPLEAFTTAR